MVYLSIENPKVLAAEAVMNDGSHSFDAMRQALLAARCEGFDGARIVGASEDGDGGGVADQWVAFCADQILNALGQPSCDAPVARRLAERMHA